MAQKSGEKRGQFFISTCEARHKRLFVVALDAVTARVTRERALGELDLFGTKKRDPHAGGGRERRDHVVYRTLGDDLTGSNDPDVGTPRRQLRKDVRAHEGGL